MERILFHTGVSNFDAQVLKHDERTTALYYTKSHDVWPSSLGTPMTYIDSVVIFKLPDLKSHLVFKQEKEYFYEMHAGLSASLSQQGHLVALHQHPDMIDQKSFGAIVKINVASKSKLTAVTSTEDWLLK